MKLRRRIGSVFLAFAMALSLIPSVAVSALAGDDAITSYVNLSYKSEEGSAGSGELKTIHVVVKDNDGNTLEEKDQENVWSTNNDISISLTEEAKDSYDIESVEISKGTVTSKNPQKDSYSFKWTYGMYQSETAVLTVVLCPQFKKPTISGGEINAGTITYKAQIPELLKLLYMNDVKDVNAGTEITGASLRFVEKFGVYGTDEPLIKMPSGADVLPYRYCALTDAVNHKNTPYNIRYLEITYTQDGGDEQTCRVESENLRYVNVGGNTYEIESNNDSKYIVAFYWEKDLSQMVWTFYDVRFVDANTPLGKENMPEDPVYPENITSYTFTNWSEGVKGETPFLPYENVTDDKVVYAQRVSSEYGGTRIRVDNTDDIMLKRFIEIYNAENDANITSVDRDSIRIQVNGTDLDGNEGNTNPNYWNNEWVGDYEYYRVVNSHIVGNHETISNTHIKHDGMKSITIYAKINGSQEISVEIPVDNNVVGGVHFTQDGALDNVAWIYFNDPPKAPSEEEIIGTPPDGLLGKNAVKVDCVNDEINPAHENATYGLLEDSFTPPTEDDIQWAAGEGEDDFGYYYIDLEVNSAKYIEEYNKTTSGHKLAEGQGETQTIRLICDEIVNDEAVWKVQTETPITFQVICETPESGYAITGITKDLVESEDEATAAGIDLDNVPFNFPDENGIVVISASGGNTTAYAKLLYKITVTGKEGAKFTVTDPGAELVSPEDDTITEQKDPIDGNNTFSGTIPESGEAVFYVSKMFSADGLVADEDSSTGTVLKNTATVKTDDAGGVDEDNDDATEETPAAEAQTIYTYIHFIGTGEDGALTQDDKEYIEETYSKAVDEWGYLPIGNFDAPLPDPTEEPYVPTGDQGTGGADFKDDFLDQIKPYITDDYNFEWVTGLNRDKFDLANGVDWIKLSVANGATSIDNTVTGYCWHLDGQIQLYAPDIDVTKTLTKVIRDGNEVQNITSDTVLEVGDTLTWTITVTNEGNKEATGLKLSDTLVAEAEDGTTSNRTATVTAVTDGVSADSFTVPAATTTDGPGKMEFTATYTVTDTDKGLTLSNTATVSDEGGNVPGGEDETENPVAERTVNIEKELTSATRDKKTVYDSTTGTLTDYKAQVGDELTYTITVENTGNVELTDVVVEDTLWEMGTWLKVNGEEAVAAADGQYTIRGPINVDASVTITYTYTVQDSDVAAGEITNTAGVYLPDGDTPDPGDEPDGKDDVTVEMDDYTINIAPANITIYTGGTGYAGVLANENGDLLNQPTSGLPQPGYHIELPDAVNAWLTEQGIDTTKVEDLSKLLHFAYDEDEQQREWGLTYMGIYDANAEGEITQYVYSLNPAVVDGEEVPVSILFTDDAGTPVTSDDIDMSAAAASAKYTISINPGKLDQDDIQAVFTVKHSEGNEKSITCNVEVGTGDLTVKSVADEEPVTNTINGTANDTTPTAVADDGVDFYVNDSQVEVASDRVGLLVDSVSNEPTFNEQMETDAISEVREDGVSLSDAQAQSYYLDLVDTKNGNAVVTMGDDDQLTIYWPMPDDADPSGDFYIVHYDEMDRTDTDMQTTAPEVKKASVTQDDNHLTFATSSFSPFVLVYEQKDSGTPTPPPVDPDDPTPPPVNPNPPQLNTEDHYAYIVGYEDGTVRPEGDITRAEVATIFFRLLTDESRNEYWSQTNDYIDVAEGDWYNNAVSTLSKAGILNGYEDGSFQPNGNITRAEFATIAARFFEATYEGEDLFPDIKDHWARDYINQAAHAGIVNGYPDGTFQPQDNITRAEAMTIVNRTLDRHPDADHFLDNMVTWPDNPETAWYYEQVQEATNSHEYIMKTDADKNPYEIWKEILPVRDWSELENTWSEAHAG